MASRCRNTRGHRIPQMPSLEDQLPRPRSSPGLEVLDVLDFGEAWPAIPRCNEFWDQEMCGRNATKMWKCTSRGALVFSMKMYWLLGKHIVLQVGKHVSCVCQLVLFEQYVAGE